jgi:hypothetical protein
MKPVRTQVVDALLELAHGLQRDSAAEVDERKGRVRFVSADHDVFRGDLDAFRAFVSSTKIPPCAP